jgi:hypothetical protein
VNRYVAATTLPVSAEQAFAYHERPGALQRLVPPWQNVRVEHSDGSLAPGSTVVLRITAGPARLRWVAVHTDYDPPHLFADTQEKGPFRSWHHRHRFEPAGDSGCLLRDEIDYELPFGALGGWFGSGAAAANLESMFSYRHRVTRDDLQLASKHDVPRLRIAVSGTSGLVGARLCSFLTLIGHDVIRLERSLEKVDDPEAAIAPWDSEQQAARLSGVDAVVHLAGKSIASGRWNEQVKREIRDSRVLMTRQLAESLASLHRPPKVFVCASATGIYGDRGDDVLDEQSEIGDDFLAGVAAEWEQACSPAADAGIRVANARFGIVLDPNGGALQKMLLPAKLFGGALGSGKQWWSWVALDDVVGAIYHLICRDDVSGPVNVVAPEPLTNKAFAQALGGVISRPALIPAPAFGLRLALGDMADALLLASTRVEPNVLRESGYEFRFPTADAALRYCLGKERLESIE